MRRGFRMPFALAAALTILIAAGVAMAAPKSRDIVDQQQVNDLGWCTSVGGGQTVAQTFTAGVNGDLTRVSLNLAKRPGFNETTMESVLPGDLIVEIRTTAPATVCLNGCNNGTGTAVVPTQQVMATAVLSQAAVAEYNPQWYEVSFADPAALTKGEVYAIVLRTNDPLPGWDVVAGSYDWHEYGDTAYDAYPGGQASASNANIPYGWSVNSYYHEDMDFLTYMKIVKSPR